MSRVMTIVLALAAVAMPAASQTAPEYPYVGLVTNDRVTVRTTAQNLPTNGVTRLNVGAEVVVVGKTGEWAKIKPPVGSFSVIPSPGVEKDATGPGGTVRESKFGWPVWAGSVINTSTADWPMQVKLQKGHRVQIVGEMLDEGRLFYKITPPEGMYMYVLAQYVARKDGAAAPRGGDAPPGTIGGGNERTGPDSTGPAPEVKLPEAPKVDPMMQAALKGVREAEAAMKAEFAKPAARQDLEGLKKRYEILKAEHGKRLPGRIEGGIRTVEIAIERRRKIMELETQYGALGLMDTTKISQPVLSVRGPFAACGTLSSSDVFEGTQAGFRKYKVHDRSDPMRIVAYVQSDTIDLSKYIGKYVGINGEVRTLAGSLPIVTAAQVTELGAGELPNLSQPVVTGPVVSGPVVEPAGEAPRKTPAEQPKEPKTPVVEPGFRSGDAGTPPAAGGTSEEGGIVVIPEQPVMGAKETPKETPRETPKEAPKKPESRPAPADQPPSAFKIAPEEPTSQPANPEEYK